MEFATLDMIVMRSLLEKRLPIHFYIEYLVHASASIRELTKDTLMAIRTVNLPVSSYASIDLPDDFVDDVGVFIPLGGTLSAIPKQDFLSPIRIHSTTTGRFIPQTIPVTAGTDGTFFGFPGIWGSWYWNISEYGEPTGRYYGANGGTAQGYKVVKERRQIQLTDNFIGDGNSLILQYVSNGQSADNATQVEWMAFSCIQAYINWKCTKNASFKDSPEARTYYNEKRLLKAELDDLTRVDIINIFRNSYRASLKT